MTNLNRPMYILMEKLFLDNDESIYNKLTNILEKNSPIVTCANLSD